MGEQEEAGAPSGEVGGPPELSPAGSAVPPGGRLRRSLGGRRYVVKVRLSARELAALEARAGQAGVSKQRFLVELATRGKWAPAERHGLYRVLYSMQVLTSGVANNLNQLARVANTTGQVLPGYEATAWAVQDTMGALRELLAGLAGLPEEGSG